MTNGIETKNAIIKSVRLGTDERGLDFTLDLDYGDSGHQCFGGYTLTQYDKETKTRRGTAYGLEAIIRVLDVVGVNNWEDLKGKYIRVKAEYTKIHAIGNIIQDKWLDMAELHKEFYPEKIEEKEAEHNADKLWTSAPDAMKNLVCPDKKNKKEEIDRLGKEKYLIYGDNGYEGRYFYIEHDRVIKQGVFYTDANLFNDLKYSSSLVIRVNKSALKIEKNIFNKETTSFKDIPETSADKSLEFYLTTTGMKQKNIDEIISKVKLILTF